MGVRGDRSLPLPGSVGQVCLILRVYVYRCRLSFHVSLLHVSWSMSLSVSGAWSTLVMSSEPAKVKLLLDTSDAHNVMKSGEKFWSMWV